jgi:hypothetical protein
MCHVRKRSKTRLLRLNTMRFATWCAATPTHMYTMAFLLYHTKTYEKAPYHRHNLEHTSVPRVASTRARRHRGIFPVSTLVWSKSV